MPASASRVRRSTVTRAPCATLIFAMSSVTTPSGAASETYPRLLSLAVHEFRTPLSVVGGYLRLLQHPNAEPLTDHQRRMITEAEKSCKRLTTLIAQLSDIAKLDNGLLPLSRHPIDLFALISDVAAHVHKAEHR